MKESFLLIKNKYEMGAYDLEDLLNMVENKIINKEEFFDITTFNYDGLKSRIKKSKDQN